jgi:hypothetical protein
VQELLQELPGVERDLQKNLLEPEDPLPLNPATADLESFAALASWRKRVFGFAYTESEFRQIFEVTPEGHVGERHAKAAVPMAVIAGEQKYGDIRVPVLAIYAVPHYLGLLGNNDPAARAAIEDRDATSTTQQANAFEPGREMRAFLASLH